MITDETPPTSANWRRALPWLNLALTALLIAAGLWYLSSRMRLADVWAALAAAAPGWVLLAVAIFVLTLLLKSWRWQLMFPAGSTPIPFRAAFWGVALGQYVNLIIPFLRLGELARLYALNRETGTPPSQALGTLVVEKTLDLIFFGLTIVFVLPFVVLPDYVNRPGPWLLALPAALLFVLYLLAYRTAWVIELWRRVLRPLPERPAAWLLRVAVSGLEGLAALRERRRAALLLLVSLVLATLAMVLPYVLFPAFGLALTFLDAALIHIVVSIAITPPSTPAKVGVFNAAAALVLLQLGVRDETVVAGYAILFYLVVIAPQIVFGLIAASRTQWHWSAASQP